MGQEKPKTPAGVQAYWVRSESCWKFKYAFRPKGMKPVRAGGWPTAKAAKAALDKAKVQTLSDRASGMKPIDREHLWKEAFAYYREHRLSSVRRKTQETYGYDLAYWEKRIGDLRISSVDQGDVQELMDRDKVHFGPWNQKRKASMLRTVFNKVVVKKRWAHRHENPAVGLELEKTKRRDGDVPVELIERFLKECKNSRQRFLEPFVWIGCYTGLRTGNVLDIRWSDIDWTPPFPELPDFEGLLHVPGEEKGGRRGTKNEDDMTCWIHPQLALVLRSLMPSAERRFGGDDRLFPLKSLRTAWVEARVRAGFEPGEMRGLHDLRHGFSKLLKEQGMPLTLIALLMGHREVEQTQQYGKAELTPMMGRVLLDAMAKLPSYGG